MKLVNAETKPQRHTLQNVRTFVKKIWHFLCYILFPILDVVNLYLGIMICITVACLMAMSLYDVTKGLTIDSSYTYEIMLVAWTVFPIAISQVSLLIKLPISDKSKFCSFCRSFSLSYLSIVVQNYTCVYRKRKILAFGRLSRNVH